jgi:hypothetical protein
MQVIMASRLGGPEVLQVGEVAVPQPRSGEPTSRVVVWPPPTAPESRTQEDDRP